MPIIIDVLELKLHRDTDSPFSIMQDANDNWQEIMDYTIEVKEAIASLEEGMGELTPEAVKALIRELLIESKLTYIISKDMANGETISFTDGTVLVRNNNTFIFSIENADKRLLMVSDMGDFSELHPVITTTATEIKIYFDIAPTNNVRVLMM